ncbi:MAG: hypothetical protein BGO55_22870 [Sphingobacteriales bacterium 50-39]|nr:DUF1269 domain-containing protein [Sphingobacteriales bacterium]OJW58156.1 MAG: hypothetical protein BGO55_22870 [Sphingobacteriales bacterium 50-39]
MTNLIIATFKEEAEAIEASQKFHELDSIGDITIYEMVIVKKNANGEAQVLQADTTEGLSTLSGMAIGSLIGALAGPVGFVAGMFTGTVVGTAVEADNYGFAEDFVSKAANQLQPGMASVIAEIEEDDPVFVDNSLSSLGGTLTRSDVDYEYTKHSDEEIDELDEEVAAARAKLKAASDKEKDKIRQKIVKLKEERKERIAEFKDKVKDAITDIKASAKDRKIEKLRSKIEKHHKKIADLEKQMQAVLGKESLKGAEA